KRLKSIPLPAIVGMRDGGFAILTQRLDGENLRLFYPLARSHVMTSLEDLANSFSGEIVLVTRRLGGPGIDPDRLSLHWLLASIWRYRKPIGHVLVASLFVQLFALVTPLFFQIVVDKVLVHKGFSTLLVVVIGLLLIGVFDVILQYLRSYALNHTTSRIDV